MLQFPYLFVQKLMLWRSKRCKVKFDAERPQTVVIRRRLRNMPSFADVVKDVICLFHIHEIN